MVKTRSQRAVEARALNDLRLALKIDKIREAIFGQQGYDVVLLESRANYEGMTDVERGKEMNRVYWSESIRICWRSVEDCKEFVMMMEREKIINEDKDMALGLLKACGAKGTPVALNASIFEIGVIDCCIFEFLKWDEEDIVAELVEWPRLKGSRVEYPMGYSRFREFSKAKSSVDGFRGHAFGYRGNFFRTCWVRQGGDYLYLLPDLAKEKKCRRLGDKVSLEYVLGVVKESRTDSFCCYSAQFDYGLTLPLYNLAKNVMNMIGACSAQLNCNFWEVILVCETYNERWATSGSESRITANGFLEYYAVKFVTTTDGAYLSSSYLRPCFFDLSSAGRVWNDNLLWMSGECLQWSDEEPLELNNRTIIKEISYKVSRKESFIDSVAKEGTELEVVLKKLGINRFKGVASKDDKVRRSQAKRRMAGKTPGFMEENMLTPELNTPLKLFARALRGVQLVLQDRSIELERRISQLEGEKNQFEESLTREREAFQLDLENEREAAALKLKEVRAESVAEAERLVSGSATSRNNFAGMLYQLRYTKAEILAFSEGNYEEKEIVDEEEVVEMEDGLNVAEKTVVDNQETINQEIESLCLRVVDLEGLLEVEKSSSADLQYEDRLDDNVKLSLKLEESKSQVEDKTATLLSRDLALNQLINELAKLKERVASGSWYDAELAEYRIRELNDEISGMKYLELRNSAQIRDSLIVRLDRLKTDLRRLKEREAKSRADLAEVHAKNKSLVDDLAHVRRNVRRAVQCDEEMNERINQLCARITELERELRAREMKYEKDLKFELDKRDGKITSGEGSQEMKEFLHQKEELVENMRIDLTNSWQKSIGLIRQMSEPIDQLTAELSELKAHRLRDNKRAAVTHQSFKELVVHEKDKCDGEALHQRQLSALVAIFVEEIQFLQVEKDLMQGRFFGRTCVCKLDILSIDSIGVIDRGIGTTTAEKIARGREIVVEQSPEYMASRTEIGGSSSTVSPTPTVG
ncbi:hypothetical protein GIB67_043299 [Kingdonia uniflora]|uniref:Uncharacterized protein n=1 Tax=Kingdonia uniflora TaxID=39325 RepID=A0A7J7NRJ2_9MAGN|nr:hypothetical protein GIB67_043299 [Kingdonia uniflora]